MIYHSITDGCKRGKSSLPLHQKVGMPFVTTCKKMYKTCKIVDGSMFWYTGSLAMPVIQ